MTATPDGIRRTFLWVFWLSLLLKVALSAAVPLTGDEAYFVLWGRNLDYGYYDHPPMCGWIVHTMLYLGSTPVVLRLPAVVFSQLVGLGILMAVRRLAPEKAHLASTLYLLSPLNVLNVLMTTDTPLFLFAFGSAAFFAVGMKTGGRRLFAAAGVFLGLALLSKYFAVLIALAFAVHVIVLDRSRRAWTGLALTALTAVPFALVHAAWNYTHSWATFTFNALSRGEGFDPWNLPMLALIAFYIATPPVVWLLARHWREWRRPFAGPETATYAAALTVPLACFAAVALGKSVGLHWVLPFAPFLFVLLPLWFDATEFTHAIRLTAVFSLLHVLVLASLLAAPVTVWRNHPAYESIVEGTDNGQVMEMLAPYREGFVFATRSYSRSSVLAYHLGTDVIVFGGGSKHGRQFDLTTDFRRLNGTNILLIETSSNSANGAAQFFKRTRVVRACAAGITYHLVLGHEFNYQRYRNRVLKRITERYYTPPTWLPTGRCPMRARYFPASLQ
jgi:4-amino-4-deoxy-L-arabinose transferase-like glycosyltransferase